MPSPANYFPTEKSRIVVAMSGGVDSSVAAALLVEQGHEVIGMMMRLWSEPCDGDATAVNRCCTPDQMADARRVADRLGIPFYVLDTQDTFRSTIVQFFIDEYASGRTPNPCIECNRQIRFAHLLNHAMALDADYLATGHYARIVRDDGGSRLLKGVDEDKDQSYVLHVMGQKQLAHALFPIGGYEKSEVRDLARRFGLPVASKQESQDLCFLSDGDHRRFLIQHSPGIERPGPILDESGRQLGEHRGLPFYTMGQRKGLGVSGPHPLFVLRKDAAQNALIVGPREKLGDLELVAHSVNWVSGAAPNEPRPLAVKIRYKANAVPATVTPQPDGSAVVRFDSPVAGVTPGQGAVFYDGEICVGGGIISRALRAPNQLTLVKDRVQE